MSGREDYEERKERKKERYQAKLEKAEQESKRYYESYQKMSEAIPLGQPILTDHYSANSMRNAYQRKNNQFDKSVKEDKKAEYYREKLDSLDNNNAISSDDPKAIEKLENKIQELEEYRKRVKAREHSTYELQNIGQEIRRLKERVKQLKELDELNFQEINFEGGKVIHNKEQNRIQILFDEKPNEETRTILKRHGFKWARSQGAWQRLFNKNGMYSAQWVLEEIEKLKSRGE